MRNNLRLSLGPILYYWSRDDVFEFYRRIADSPVDIVVEKLTKSKKGEIATKKLAKLTYPTGSLEALTTAFRVGARSPDGYPANDDELLEAEEVEVP